MSARADTMASFVLTLSHVTHRIYRDSPWDLTESDIQWGNYLVWNAKLVKNPRKCSSKVQSSVGYWELHNIQKQARWYTFIFKVDRQSNKCSVVWWCPHICSKAQVAIIVLDYRELSNKLKKGIDTDLQHFGYAILNTMKDGENIICHLCIWNPITWLPCLHHTNELLILNNAEACQILWHPFDTFNTNPISQPHCSVWRLNLT